MLDFSKMYFITYACFKMVSFKFLCVEPKIFLIIYLDSSCSWNQFACSAEKCISRHWICDGEDDCGDGLDESDGVCGKCFFGNSYF